MNIDKISQNAPCKLLKTLHIDNNNLYCQMLNQFLLHARVIVKEPVTK